MTYTVNGIGTSHVGTRQLTEDEYQLWSSQLPHHVKIKDKDEAYLLDKENYLITTESFVILGVPIIPLKTVVMFSPKTGFLESEKYVEVFHPAGENNIYWKHVLGMPHFYLSYLFILLAVLLYFIFNAEPVRLLISLFLGYIGLMLCINTTIPTLNSIIYRGNDFRINLGAIFWSLVGILLLCAMIFYNINIGESNFKYCGNNSSCIIAALVNNCTASSGHFDYANGRMDITVEKELTNNVVKYCNIKIDFLGRDGTASWSELKKFTYPLVYCGNNYTYEYIDELGRADCQSDVVLIRWLDGT